MNLDQILDRALRLLRNFESLEDAGPSLLKFIGPALDCGSAALGNGGVASDTLAAIATWHPTSAPSARLKEFTTRWQPAYGEGMVGKTWRTLQLQFSLNVVQDMILPRSLYAKEAGIVSGIWVPVQAHRGGFVLECLLRSAPDPTLTAILQKLADGMAELVDGVKPGNGP